MKFDRNPMDAHRQNYEIRWYNPGGESSTFHGSLRSVYDRLELYGAKLDEGGLHCLNPHGVRVSLEVLLDGEPLLPIDVARGWVGEFDQVRVKYEGSGAVRAAVAAEFASKRR